MKKVKVLFSKNRPKMFLIDGYWLQSAMDFMHFKGGSSQKFAKESEKFA